MSVTGPIDSGPMHSGLMIQKKLEKIKINMKIEPQNKYEN